VLRDQGGNPHQQLVAASRADLCAVVRNGAPAIGDPDLAFWFDACGVEVVRATLDGRDKLLSRSCLPAAEPDAALREPGLQVSPPS
jgi:hypothetical protein